jgi:hypothetical protein
MNAVRRASKSEWRINDRLLGGSRFGWTLVSALTVSLGVAVGVAWVLSSYFGVDVPASVSLVGVDGHCNGGLGVHCFGDYSAIDFASLGAQPSDPEAVYPASSRISRLPFFLIGHFAGFQAGLVTFLIVSALCLISPAVWSVRHAPWFAKGIVVTATGLTAAPVLIAWDRGNIMALAVPLIFAVMWGLARNHPWVVTAAIIAGAMMRPQFAVMALALVAVREWKAAIVSAVGSVAAVATSFFLFGSTWLTEIGNWIEVARTWTRSQPLGQNWPPNISIPRALYVLAHAGPWRDLGFVTNLPDWAYAVAGIVFAGAVVAVVVVAGRHLPPLAIAVAMLAAISLALPLAYAYYYVFALPIVALVFRDGISEWPAVRRLDKVVISAFFIALLLSLTPLLLPMGHAFQVAGGVSVVANAVPICATVAWMVFMAALAASGLVNIRKLDPRPNMREAGSMHA